MEVIFRPYVPDNVENWQVFDDDTQVIRFLNNIGDFQDNNIN